MAHSEMELFVSEYPATIVAQQHFAILQDLSSSHKEIGGSSLRLVWSIMTFHTSNIEWIIAAQETTTFHLMSATSGAFPIV